MQQYTIFTLMVLLPTCCHGFLLEDIFGKPPKTVAQLDVTPYLGRWYQVYANNNLRNTFLRNAVCVTADYRAINATTISVLNSNNIVTPDGPLDQIRGFGYKTDVEGQLSVVLNGVFIEAPYWILKLGPIINGQYQYAVVSDPIRYALFVLVRDPQDFAEKYDSDMLTYLEEAGFNEAGNKPDKVYQGKDCQYATEPPQ